MQQNTTRREALTHFEKHGLRIGGVESVVYIGRLLRLIEKLFNGN